MKREKIKRCAFTGKPVPRKCRTCPFEMSKTPAWMKRLPNRLKCKMKRGNKLKDAGNAKISALRHAESRIGQNTRKHTQNKDVGLMGPTGAIKTILKDENNNLKENTCIPGKKNIYLG